MKKLLVILCSCLIAMNCSLSLSYAEENDDNNSVTQQEKDRDISKHMKNAAMGSANPDKNLSLLDMDAPYWENNDGVKKFYDADGTLMYGEGTKLVIDVSEHNGEIDWEAVKEAGVDGAILRVGWGYLGDDQQFKRNISECNRLDIPYGIYLYSYAYDEAFATLEAEGTIEMLEGIDLNLSYPIYYDIENFTPWTDDFGITHNPPRKTAEYEKIINSYIQTMNKAGYDNVDVYSYRSYLQNELNSSEILQHVSWTAAYTSTLDFKNKYYKGEQGWQYTSSGKVSGINGNVDLSCFSDQFANIKALEIKFHDTSRTLSVGSKEKMELTISPSNADTKVSWRTGNSAIATVSNDGTVSAKAQGNTYLYAKTSNGLEAKCLIKVIVPTEEVKLPYTSKELNLHDTYTFNATVLPGHASQTVSWRTGNKNVATVDSSGKVTAVGLGNTYLYAKTVDGKEAKCLIKVTIPAESIVLSDTTRLISAGNKAKIDASLMPSNATTQITWRTGNSAIATVSNDGMISAVSEGNTYLYAKTSNGLEAKCLLKVLPEEQYVAITYTSKTIKLGTSYTFVPDVVKEHANQQLIWRTGNDAVATVDASGKVTAVGAGNTYLYVKTSDGKETKCLIKVPAVTESITLSDTTRLISAGSKVKIDAYVTPSNMNSQITWRTGNTAIATVSNDGSVNALSEGNTYLYAKTSDGLEAKCLLKVLPEGQYVSITYTSKTVKLGSSYTFEASVVKEHANQSLIWRTGNSAVATVDASGKVTAVGTGNTYLYVKTSDGKETRCLIKVQN